MWILQLSTILKLFSSLLIVISGSETGILQFPSIPNNRASNVELDVYKDFSQEADLYLKNLAPEFQSYAHLISYLVNLLEPTPNHMIIDPTCGSGGFTLERVYQYLGSNYQLELSKSVISKIFRWSIDSDTNYLSNLDQKSFIQSGSHWNNRSWAKERFDLIITDPPFQETTHQNSLRANEPVLTFIETCVSLLKVKGKAMILLPNQVDDYKVQNLCKNCAIIRRFETIYFKSNGDRIKRKLLYLEKLEYKDADLDLRENRAVERFPQLVSSSSRTSNSLQIHIDDIEEFSRVKSVRNEDVLSFLDKNGRLDMLEDEIQRKIEEIISKPFHKEDAPNELNDLRTNLHYKGELWSTSFLLKGRGCTSKEMQIADCGKNGDQLIKLFDSPSNIFIVQFVGEFSDNLVKDVWQKTDYHRLRNGVDAWFCLIDGQDTARLFHAYGLLHQEA